jgi:hypothetical protein
MNSGLFMRKLTLLSAVILLSSCNLLSQNSSYDDFRNPFIKQAQSDVDNNKLDEAIADYESALGANPKLASVHESLG